MKNDILIRIDTKNSMVYNPYRILGINEENIVNNLIFTFDNGFVDGIAWLEIEKPDGTKGFLQMEKVDETYVLPIKNSLLNQVGRINMQLRITKEENELGIPVFKSNSFYMGVNEAINSTDEIPDEYPKWIDIANAKILEMDEALKQIELHKDYNNLENKPKINNVELIDNVTLEQLGIQQKGDYIQDEDYVHTDNNYTHAEKEKLAELENYDDTLIQQELSSVGIIVEAHDLDISNLDNKVEGINETITEQEENINHLADTKQENLIAGDNITIDENNVISALAGVKVHVEDGKLVIG